MLLLTHVSFALISNIQVASLKDYLFALSVEPTLTFVVFYQVAATAVRWWQQRSTAFDGVGGGLPREGGARRGKATTSQHDERTRGWCNERTTRDDGATTSWHYAITRGGATRQRDNERAAHREATQQPAGATRGWRGAQQEEKERQSDNKRARRVDERLALREDGERQCDNQQRQCDNQLAR
jgi:hypothetical protein